MNRENAKTLLLEIASILDDIVPYFLIQGTALGAYRDNDFTPTEGDIDIGFLWEDFKPSYQQLIDRLNQGGYDLKVIDDTFSHPRIIIAHKYGEHADLVSFMKWGDKRFALTPAWYANYALVHNADYLENTEVISLFGRDFRVPCPIEDYLKSEYDDWRTPRKDNTSRLRVYDFMKVSGVRPEDY